MDVAFRWSGDAEGGMPVVTRETTVSSLSTYFTRLLKSRSFVKLARY